MINGWFKSTLFGLPVAVVGLVTVFGRQFLHPLADYHSWGVVARVCEHSPIVSNKYRVVLYRSFMSMWVRARWCKSSERTHALRPEPVNPKPLNPKPLNPEALT